MLSELRSRVPRAGRIVELGVGPGYLAARVLDALPAVRYQAVDFSRPMLDIAARRLRRHADRVTFTRADLLADGWVAGPEPPRGRPSSRPGRCTISAAKPGSSTSTPGARRSSAAGGCC